MVDSAAARKVASESRDCGSRASRSLSQKGPQGERLLRRRRPFSNLLGSIRPALHESCHPRGTRGMIDQHGTHCLFKQFQARVGGQQQEEGEHGNNLRRFVIKMRLNRRFGVANGPFWVLF